MILPRDMEFGAVPDGDGGLQDSFTSLMHQIFPSISPETLDTFFRISRILSDGFDSGEAGEGMWSRMQPILQKMPPEARYSVWKTILLLYENERLGPYSTEARRKANFLAYAVVCNEYPKRIRLAQTGFPAWMICPESAAENFPLLSDSVSPAAQEEVFREVELMAAHTQEMYPGEELYFVWAEPEEAKVALCFIPRSLITEI